MSFYQTLQDKTINDRQQLMMAPIIDVCRHKKITQSEYVYFLTQAYHHVKHTVPLLKACKDHLPANYEWLKSALDLYIAEEEGHEQWILNDIEACGGDRRQVEASEGSPAIQAMVDYLYDQIEQAQPLSLFGMVQVLEGTSVSIACEMADDIQATLGLPGEAMTYLQSHGNLDQEHLKYFESLMNKITDQADQNNIIESAHQVYKHYSEMLYSIHPHNGINA
jgi:pyrroloquinoline quinone (PQQ) biosynthesis protein C